MSFFERLKNMFVAPGGIDRRSYWVNVRCKRCGEVITSRVDLLNDLSKDFDAKQFTAHKVLVGDGRNRCFQRIEVSLTFDKNKKVVDRSITGGEFLEPDEVEAAKTAYEQKIAEMKARAEAEGKAREAALAASPDETTEQSPNP